MTDFDLARAETQQIVRDTLTRCGGAVANWVLWRNPRLYELGFACGTMRVYGWMAEIAAPDVQPGALGFGKTTVWRLREAVRV